MRAVDELLQDAQAATSLADFGEESFREGLERLVAAARAEAQFSEGGRLALEMQIVGLLTSRLQVEHWYKLHPEIEEQEIIAPLIGLGLPRTGSTALSCLLAEDPEARYIRYWESLAPCPPPEPATQLSDPRIAMADQVVAGFDALYPRLKTMVPGSATAPTECQSYMGYDFKSQLFQAFAQIPSYVEWLNFKADLLPTYRYVKRVLKLLQWRYPQKRWRLKSPTHSLFIDTLSKVFPDARFWMTHRDVGNVIPSVADLYYELTKAGTEHVDKLGIGALVTNFCELGMRRMIAFRDAGNDHRFFDVQFRDFQAAPFSSLTRLYEFMGERLTPEVQARMDLWRRNTPRDKHGEHIYDPADFGLDPVQLQHRFKFYSDRFKVPLQRTEGRLE